MGLGRYAYVAGVVAMIPLLGCSLTTGAIVEHGFCSRETTAAGVRVEGVAHLPSQSGDGLAAGIRIDHLAQITPAATYDRSRYELLFGYSRVPRGFLARFGVDALVRVGGARGAMGGIESTPIAFSAGVTLGMPIRLTPSPFGADEVLRFTLLLVPQLDGGIAGPIEGTWQPQISGTIGLRVHLDSTLLP